MHNLVPFVLSLAWIVMLRWSVADPLPVRIRVVDFDRPWSMVDPSESDKAVAAALRSLAKVERFICDRDLFTGTGVAFIFYRGRRLKLEITPVGVDDRAVSDV